MRIIQSSWSCGQSDFINYNGGWVAPEYKLMGWALSCLQLRAFYPEVVLYADSPSAEVLIDTLRLPYSDVVCNLDSLNAFHPQLWALPKIAAYAQQEAPFLHVDSDVFIWEAFDQQLMDSPLIAQNEEEETNYYRDMFEPMDHHFNYFPAEILADREQQQPVRAYNAGILGGQHVSFFTEYTQKALDFIHYNTSAFSSIDVGNFNIFFEQYLFYCLAKTKGVPVGVLFDEIMGDNRYEGFGDFIDVPHKKKFLHLLGVYKRNTRCCEYMANRLRKDYPEYYYRIFQLFRDRGLPFRGDSFSFVHETNESALVERYDGLLKGTLSGTDAKRWTPKPFSNWRSTLIDEYFREHEVPGYDAFTIGELRVAAVDFEEKVSHLISEKFPRLSLTALYQRDIQSASYVEKVFSDELGIDRKKLIKAEIFDTVPTDFDWAFIELSGIQLKIGFQLLLDSRQENNRVAIIPECFGYGYTITNIDELDELMISHLDCTRTIGELLDLVSSSFDPEELQETGDAFRQLIYGRIKTGLWTKILMLVDD